MPAPLGYRPSLGAHTDFVSDELSVIVQFHRGAFFFVFDNTVAVQPSFEDVTESHLVHMEPGELVIFHGNEQYHGCRPLKEGERRLQMTLFYTLPHHYDMCDTGADLEELANLDEGNLENL